MKEIPRRFYGQHNDFHAIPRKVLVIGATLREEDIRAMCEAIRPDFIQIDCKGHPGFASYPSKLGNAMPEFAFDTLEMWRRVTREYGISLYMHYSGLYDKKYCEEHPEARVLRADGTLADYVRFESKYADELMIPQIVELYENYSIDGIWVDGDCWAAQNDYHPETLALFERQTGIDLAGKAPRSYADPYFREYLDFTRQRFREFLRHYVDAVHEKCPGLEICSNWAFSDHMHEAVCADVDFISGDLNPDNCVNSARYAGRMMAQQNLPWDLMSWHFRFNYYGAPLTPPKHVSQIMQEAAAVIALGGGFQDNIQQFDDASPNVEQTLEIKALAKFMREREDYCYNGRQVHQMAVLISQFDTLSDMEKPFVRGKRDEFIALTGLLCDSGISFEELGEYNLCGRMKDYPVILVPELTYGLDDATVSELRDYVTGGGSLILMGINTARIFSKAGFPFDTESFRIPPQLANWTNGDVGHYSGSETAGSHCYIRVNGGLCGQSTGVEVIKADGARVLATAHSYLRGEGLPFASVMSFGKGKLAVIGTNLALQYKDGAQYQHRQLIKLVCDGLFEPILKVEAALGLLETVCLEKDGRLMLQLVNGNGSHSNPNVMLEDHIPPVLDITLSLKADAAPKKLVLRPEGHALDFVHKNGRVYFEIPRIDIHSVVEVITE